MLTPGTGYPYEDPPPPSTLNAYRSSRSVDNEHKIPRKAPPCASPPVSNLVYQSQIAKPKANPPVQLGRSDSLLDRVFTYLGNDAHASNTDLDHGTESQPSRPTSLWRAGSANVVPRHVPELSSVTQANVPDDVDPRSITPVRGNVVGTGGIPSQDEETPIPPHKESHTRDMVERLVTPRSGVGQDHPFPLPPLRAEFEPRRNIPDKGHVDPRAIYPFPIPDSQIPPPPQQYAAAGPSSPSDLERPRRASRNEALLRPFPEPAHHPLPNMGPTRFTAPRSKLKMPAPLAQPLPRGSGSLKRNRTNTLPVPEQYVLPSEEQYWESRSRRHSQPIPTPRHTTGPNSVPHPPNSPSRNPHRRISQQLPVLREASHPYVNPPSSPPQRSSRRLSSPPMSALSPRRPTRSNAIHRKSPDSHSPTQATSPRMSLLAELRSAPPTDSDNFSRYPIPGPGSGTGLPLRVSRTRSPPSPRTPPFVNTHMLPLLTSSPRSDVEEWASAVSSFPPSVRTKQQ